MILEEESSIKFDQLPDFPYRSVLQELKSQLFPPSSFQPSSRPRGSPKDANNSKPAAKRATLNEKFSPENIAKAQSKAFETKFKSLKINMQEEKVKKEMILDESKVVLKPYEDCPDKDSITRMKEVKKKFCDYFGYSPENVIVAGSGSPAARLSRHPKVIVICPNYAKKLDPELATNQLSSGQREQKR